MKTLFVLFISIFISTIGSAQQKKSADLKVISYNSRFKTYFTNGAVENFGNTIKIAFLRDYILYEMPTQHYESPTSSINLDETKDGDTIHFENNDAPILKKITYEYFVIKSGKKSGLWFKDSNSSGQPFLLDSLLKSNGMDSLNKRFLSTNFGTPTEIVKTKNGKIELEKFYNLKKRDDQPDTVFRYYDAQLRGLNFSLSPSLDKEKQSKLYKSIYVSKRKYSLAKTTAMEPYKLELLDEFNLITAKCTKTQLEVFEILFDKYITQVEK